jgi:hypothetical protein
MPIDGDWRIVLTSILFHDMSTTCHLAGKESLAIPTAVETESSSSKEFILDLKVRPHN